MKTVHKLTVIFCLLAAIGLSWLAWPLENASSWILVIWVLLGIPAVFALFELDKPEDAEHVG